MRRRSSICLIAALAVLVPAASADARECAKTAKLRSGELSRLDIQKHVRAGATLGRGKPFVAERDSKIRFQSVTYKLEGGSVFMLACFGHSRAQGAIYPRIELRKGKSKVVTTTGKPGAISTPEAMADPYRDVGMAIVVTRNPRNDNPMFGRTMVDKVAGRGYVNLTPYVGSRPGTCRQVDGGTFVSKRLDSRGFSVGTADYRGYAPGSPR